MPIVTPPTACASSPAFSVFTVSLFSVSLRWLSSLGGSAKPRAYESSVHDARVRPALAGARSCPRRTHLGYNAAHADAAPGAHTPDGGDPAVHEADVGSGARARRSLQAHGPLARRHRAAAAGDPRAGPRTGEHRQRHLADARHAPEHAH